MLKKFHILGLFLLAITSSNAQCSQCSDKDVQEIALCLSQHTFTGVLDTTQVEGQTKACDIQHEQIKCYKPCYCKCLKQNPQNIMAKLTSLREYCKNDFTENCVVWKDGELRINDTNLLKPNYFLIMISCLILLTTK